MNDTEIIANVDTNAWHLIQQNPIILRWIQSLPWCWKAIALKQLETALTAIKGNKTNNNTIKQITMVLDKITDMLLTCARTATSAKSGYHITLIEKES